MDYFTAVKTPENFERRRKWMILAIHLCCFMFGCENAIIYPTAWKYLQEMGIHDEKVLGFVISAFSVSALVSGVVLGILADKRERSRLVVLSFTLCSIAGNAMYFVGGNAWMLIMGRLVAGIGAGTITVLLSELAKATRMAERTKVTAIAFIARQVGILLGPAYNVMIGGLSFGVGFRVVSETNFSGFLMSILWTIHGILMFFLYFDAGLEMKSILEAEALGSKPQTSYDAAAMQLKPLDSSPTNGSGDRLEGREHSISKVDGSHDSTDENISSKMGSQVDLVSEEKTGAESSLSCGSRDNLVQKYMDVFLTDTMVPLLFLQFLAFFLQNALETTIPPTNQTYFGFGPWTNSFVYLAIGLENIFVYAIYSSVLKYVSERFMLVASCALMVFGCGFSLVVSVFFEEGKLDLFPFYMIGCTIIFLAVAMAFMTTLTIFLKALPSDVQGGAQGIRFVCNFLGLMVGGLFGGGLANDAVALYSIPMFMAIIALILCSASYSRYQNLLEKK